MRSIEEIVKYLLNKLNLKTESDLAKILGVEANTLSGWKKRKKIPFENLLKISDEYKISFDEILAITDKQSPATESEKELLAYFKKLPKDKQEIYLLRIKADAIEIGLN